MNASEATASADLCIMRESGRWVDDWAAEVGDLRSLATMQMTWLTRDPMEEVSFESRDVMTACAWHSNWKTVGFELTGSKGLWNRPNGYPLMKTQLQLNRPNLFS